MLDTLEYRHGLGSTIITPPMPVDSRHSYLGDPTLADAILDRLTAYAHRIALTGRTPRSKKIH